MAKKCSGSSLASLLETYSAEKQDTLVPTGIIPVDTLFGGGICPGAMYCFWGIQGSGKSTIALQIAKSYLKNGDKVLWLDVEKALNPKQQENFGVRQYVENGSLLHVKADTYVQADEITTAIANDTDMGIKLVVVDSETMLLPKMGDDQAVDDNQPGQKARQASLWLTKVKAQFFDAGITIIVLAHARANIDLKAGPYAPEHKQAGGYAMKHVPDCILQIQPGSKFGERDKPDGQVLHLMTDKNKFAPPFVKRDTKLFFGKGIRRSVEVIDWAIVNGVITQNGSFFKFNDETYHGADALYRMDESQVNALYDIYNATLEN